jgi:hypothetical protein
MNAILEIRILMPKSHMCSQDTSVSFKSCGEGVRYRYTVITYKAYSVIYDLSPHMGILDCYTSMGFRQNIGTPMQIRPLPLPS